MRKLRVCLDTSVVNFLFAEDAPDLHRMTLEFFATGGAQCRLFTSEVMLREISRHPDPRERGRLSAALGEHRVTVLPYDSAGDVARLAERYIRMGVFTLGQRDDALHVAHAVLNRMDVLLSWNFKHLANIRREARILAANIEIGCRYPLRIVSPAEMTDEKA